MGICPQIRSVDGDPSGRGEQGADRFQKRRLAASVFAGDRRDPAGQKLQPVNMKIVDVSLLSQVWHDHDILEPIFPDDESYG